ncbi:uncharacterized protein K441DRAFT_689486 [Cenococcum geophilum 1.58]|uniref:uncharacterized protein n=1 Tax=Cenococcum geophilum 1.58 TaxID=794803 RepID=UPI00358FDA02|nr:hypothetical protein K441DRAFT_689486 [Cenococcum geophilum 1.58]
MASSAPDPEETPLLAAPADFISHTLSTWNSRVFEFGAVLYLATIFPDTLLPMSVYALTRGVSAIFLITRFSQRLAVAASCVAFWFLASGWSIPRGLQWGLFTMLTVLACIEKLASVMNLVSVEKDWVRFAQSLDLNAQMRRIGLICKLAGPFFISIIDGASAEVAILLNLGMNLASVVVEYFAIARVYEVVLALQQSKTLSYVLPTGDTIDAMRGYLRDLYTYFRHQAFLPSFSRALPYFTVLNFAGQMVTYLLASGYNSFHIGIARTLSVISEIASTWTAPSVMSGVGPIRAGIWFINCQILCLAGAAAASGLVVGTILSQVRLRRFDLCAQIIVQEEVEAERRGSFSSLEALWQNLFEICSYASTIIFFWPEQFRWPVLMSCMVVFFAGILYTFFVRSRRGHLLHLPACIALQDRKTRSSEPSSERLLFDQETSNSVP